MALNIKNAEADRLARELAARTGESITEAVINALRERLRRERGRVSGPSLAEELLRIRQRCASLPVLEEGTADELIGYDADGLPR